MASNMGRFSIALFLIVIEFVYIYAKSPNLNDVIFNGDYNFIDLTYPFDDKTIYWNNVQKFEFTKINGYFRQDGSWYAGNEFVVAEHGGTHLDAPYHLNANGKHVGEIPLEKLIVPLIIVDISGLVNDDPNFMLHKHHLDYMLSDNHDKPYVIIFKFGWSKFAKDRKKYLGLDKDNKLHFPGISVEVAEWIVSSYKKVVGVGVDTSSVDPGSVIDLAAHKILAAAGLFNLENVKLDTHVPEYGCTALVMPMKIAMGTGAPLRLVALCPKQEK